MIEPSPSSRVMVLMFTDLVGSVDLKQRLGSDRYTGILARHDTLFQSIVAGTAGAEILKDTGDGFLARFDRSSDAIRVSLAFQRALGQEGWDGASVHVRIGLHKGEVAEMACGADGRRKIVGLPADLCSRTMDLAQGGQILLTRAVFDDGRQLVDDAHGDAPGEGRGELRWMAHGPYLFKGAEEPVEIFEVGVKGSAPLRAPPDSAKARRAIPVGEEQMYGWRPAVMLPVPGRAHWILERKLGEGGFGEVWLAAHQRTGARRVFKFCFDADRLRNLKRELTLFRLLRESLGDRPDIARIHDMRLDEPPFYLESDFTDQGSLAEWAAGRGGIDQVPLETRLALIGGVCDAVAAAHSLGILHKDLKPSNILIYLTAGGQPRPQLADFGIGTITDRSQLDRHGVTMTGFTQSIVEGEDTTRAGTRLYTPPENLVGQPFTTQGDVYGLGVMLYQMVAGDLNRPLAQGWEADIDDEVLRDDIARAVSRPEDRLASASELSRRLRTLDERREALLLERRAAQAARKRERAMRLVAGAAIALTALIAVAGFMVMREFRLRVHAELALDNADVARRAEATQRREAEYRAYLVQVAAAANALEDGAITTALRRLEQVPMGMRGWECWALGNLADQSLGVIAGADAELLSVAFSPDGARLAAATSDGDVGLWDVATGMGVSFLPGHAGPVYALAFSPDGTRLASGSADATVRLWNGTTGVELGELRGHDGVVTSLAFLPDGHLLTASSDTTIRRWDVRSGEGRIVVADSAGGSVDCLAVTRDGRRLAWGSDDQIVRVRDMDTDAPATEFAGHDGYVTAVAWDPEGRRVASSSSDGTVRVWSADSADAPIVLRGHDRYVTSVVFSPDGTHLASASEDATIRLWSAASGVAVAALRGHADIVHEVAFEPAGGRLASASADGTGRLWHADRRDHLVPELGVERGAVRSIVFAGGGERLAIGYDDGTVTLCDLRGGRVVATVTAHDGPVLAADVSDDGRYLATGGYDGTVVLCDASSGAAVTTLAAHQRLVAGIAFDAGGALLSSSWDGTVRRWTVPGGSPLGTPLELDGSVTAVATDHDGDRFATGTAKGVVDLWHGRTGERVATLFAHRATVQALAFSPDGALLVSASADGTLRTWDASDGAARSTLRGHDGAVTSVAFTSIDNRLASGGDDGTVRVWDVATAEQLVTIAAAEGAVTCLVFSPDGTRLAAGTSTGVVLLRDSMDPALRYTPDGP